FPMRDGSAVKITTARYFTPKGRDINAVGIEPEIKADAPKNVRIAAGDPSKDPQLAAAVTFLDGRLAQNPTTPGPNN
ncbi:MAG TPA: S41 family peptidase, partial [Candidatus Elarobacter sp.]|nr:S41 family peptidase [Candidatus Elarobacter sp.]